MDPNTVSVIIPTYNRASLLLEALESLKLQNHRPLEVIVVDDGSTDGTEEAVKSWIFENSNTHFAVNYLKQENSGAPRARNNGFMASNSPYVMFMDSDDLVCSEGMRTLVEVIARREDLDFVYGKVVKTDFQCNPWNEDATGEPIIERPDYLADYHWHTMGAIYRRNLVEQSALWNEDLTGSQDWEFQARIKLRTKDFLFVDCLVGYWRQHSDNRVGTFEFRYDYVRSVEKASLSIWNMAETNNVANRSLARRISRKLFIHALEFSCNGFVDDRVRLLNEIKHLLPGDMELKLMAAWRYMPLCMDRVVFNKLKYRPSNYITTTSKSGRRPLRQRTDPSLPQNVLDHSCLPRDDGLDESPIFITKDHPILIFCPFTYGGLFEYTLHHAVALGGKVPIELLMPSNTDTKRIESLGLKVHLDLPSDEPFDRTVPALHPIRSVYRVLANYRILAKRIHSDHTRRVLFSAYAEYLAPIWAGPFQDLRRSGVRFAAVVHDPIRDFQVGPAWWHKKSIAAAYSCLDLAFVHEPVSLEMIETTPPPKTVVVPHGPYPLPAPNQDPHTTRRKIGVPPDAPLFLSFGHIRDGKNLDLVIRALPDFPELYLVVAGKEQSAAQKPARFYQQLAESIGVADRCRFFPRYVEDQEAANFVAAVDVILLTYSSQFHSASGVLNLVAPHRKKLLASAGKGPLQTVVRDYRLGTWVEPDDLEALKRGIPAVLAFDPDRARWKDYLRDHTWEENASIILRALSSLD